MSWKYEQSSGKMFADSGELVGIGYSGAPGHKNKPEDEPLHNQGPIPHGHWIIFDPPFDTAEHGPYVLRLTPLATTETYGRSGFLIHGDSVHAPGTASEGCIILSRDVRQKIWGSGDREVNVVSGLPDEDVTA